MIFLLGRMRGDTAATPASSRSSRASATTGTSSTSSGSASSAACSSSSRHASTSRGTYRSTTDRPRTPVCLLPGRPARRVAGLASLAVFVARRHRPGPAGTPTLARSSHLRTPRRHPGVRHRQHQGRHPTPNTGNPFTSSHLHCHDGHLVSYGNNVHHLRQPAAVLHRGRPGCCSPRPARAATATTPTASVPRARPRSARTCRASAPATVDFWVATGRMPAADVKPVQAERKPTRLTPTAGARDRRLRQLARPGRARRSRTRTCTDANRRDGADLFSLNCAACHTITGAGDALAFGTTPRRCSPGITAPAGGRGHPDRPGQHAPLHGQPDRRPGARHRRVRDRPDPAPDQPRRLRPRRRRPGGRGLRRPALRGRRLALVCFWIGERRERRTPTTEPSRTHGSPHAGGRARRPAPGDAARHPQRAERIIAVDLPRRPRVRRRLRRRLLAELERRGSRRHPRRRPVPPRASA